VNVTAILYLSGHKNLFHLNERTAGASAESYDESSQTEVWMIELCQPYTTVQRPRLAAVIGDRVYESEQLRHVPRGNGERFAVFAGELAVLRVDGFDGVAQCVLELVLSIGRCGL